MKNTKNTLKISLNFLFVVLLICYSSVNKVSINALIEENNIIDNISSYDRNSWVWNTTEFISTESSGNIAELVPSIAVDSFGNVHVAWIDITDFAGAGIDKDIFYKRWDASSALWTTTEVVSTESSGASRDPVIALDSAGNVHLSWEDFTDYAGCGTDPDIFYKQKKASTSTWTITEVVSTESTNASSNPSLAVDFNNDVHIAWQDKTNYTNAGVELDIFYKFLDTSSSSWTTTKVVSTESTSDSTDPTIAVDSARNIHIAWIDETDFAGANVDPDIFYKRWETSSSSWTISEVLTPESILWSNWPSIAVDSSRNVHIVWSMEDSDPFRIRYKQWNYASSTWTSNIDLSTESDMFAVIPSLAVDSFGNVHVVWRDETDYLGAGYDMDIFYKYWDASLSLWSSTEIVSTESTEHCYSASIATSSTGEVHVVWNDWTDLAGSGASDIDLFYKFLAGPPSNPELAFIVPNPTDLSSVYLDWDDVFRTKLYHVYRTTNYIWSVQGLTPVASISSSEYIDILPAEGYYYYVIVAENFAGNSSHSNCQYIEYQLPSLNELIIISGLIIGTTVTLFIIFRTRKKNPKLN